jgi:hypothetical protein
MTPSDADDLFEVERCRRKRLVLDACLKLQSENDKAAIAEILSAVRDAFIIGHKILHTVRPDPNLAPTGRILALIEDPTPEVSIAAIGAAAELCQRDSGNEHLFAERLCKALACNNGAQVSVAIAALRNCGQHAASIAIDRVVECAGWLDANVQRELCRTLPIFGDALPARLPQLCTGVAALEVPEMQLELLRAILQSLDSDSMDVSSVANALCSAMERESALALLRRLNSLGHRVGLVIEEGSQTTNTVKAPIGLVKYPHRVVFPDATTQEVDVTTWEILKLLIDSYPSPVSMSASGYRSRDLDKLVTKYTRIASWIKRSPAAGTSLRPRPEETQKGVKGRIK